MTGSILSDRQIAVLKLLGSHPWLRETFYLTGGTALAGFYLQHRLSEDLDFFAEHEFDLASLTTSLQTVKGKMGYKKADLQQSFNRNLVFLHFDTEILKLEFTYFPFPRIEKGGRKYDLQIDSLTDIAVNKLFTIYQQVRARDYIGLYCICKERGFDLQDLLDKARAKFDWHIDPLQLGAQFLKIVEAKDYPRMLKEITPEGWQQFFLSEAKKLKSAILE